MLAQYVRLAQAKCNKFDIPWKETPKQNKTKQKTSTNQPTNQTNCNHKNNQTQRNLKSNNSKKTKTKANRAISTSTHPIHPWSMITSGLVCVCLWGLGRGLGFFVVVCVGCLVFFFSLLLFLLKQSTPPPPLPPPPLNPFLTWTWEPEDQNT